MKYLCQQTCSKLILKKVKDHMSSFNQQTAKAETEKLSILKKLSYVLDSRQKRQCLGIFVLILISGVLETVGVSMIVPIVSAITAPDTITEYLDKYPFLRNFTDSLGLTTTFRLTIAMLVALMAIYIIKNAFLLFVTYHQNRFITNARNDMISRVLRDFLNRPYEDYLGADIPTVFRITDSDIPQTFSLILCLLQMSTEIVVSMFLGIFLLVVNWQMTLFIVLILLCMTLISTKFIKPKLNSIGARNQHIQSRIAKWRLQAIYGLKDVKVLNRQDFFIRNYYESGKIGATDYAVFNNLPRLMIETVFMVSVMGFITLYMLGGGDVTALITQLMAFAVAAVRILPSANRINTYMAQAAYEEPSLNYLYDNLTESNKTEGEMRARASEIAGPALHLSDRIELKDISFHYPDSDTYIFRHANMEIQKGQSVGIMGPSGAGKSTIVDILLGLLHAESGQILCDGADIFSNYDSWLAQIGYIPQSIYLIDESIRENIAFGIDADKVSEERIWEILKEAQLDEFIRSLPEGLDTRIGDRGVRLSGGQRQRIGIARALYHNPEILVFDEATSALDNDTEAALMEAINSFHGKKTMIIIAHRLNTIEKCDRIYKVADETITLTTLEGERHA